MRSRLYKFLRWSEKYTKTDMVYLAKGGLWLSLGQGVAILSGFLLSIAFANLFPKESFGNYKFIISVAGIIGAFSLVGMGTAITQAVSRGFGNSLHSGFRINLKWSLAVFLGGLVLGVYYYTNNNIVLAFSFLLMGVTLPIALSAKLYGSYLLGKKDFKRNSLYGMIYSAAPAAAIVIALLLTQNLLTIVTVYFVFGSLVPLFLYYKTTRVYQNENKKDDPELLSYSGHLSVMEIIGAVASHLDKILIFHYLGAAPLAIYAFAVAPVEQLQGGKKILSTLIKPKLGERSFEELQKSSPRKAFLSVVYALGLAGVYILLAPYLYKIFFPQYLDSVFYSQIYSLTLVAVAGTIFNETLIAHKRKKELYVHRTIIPIVQIILFLTLLPAFGLIGLIAAHITSKVLGILLIYCLVEHPIGN